MNGGRLEPMVREVRRLAAERPDFVYEDQPDSLGAGVCFYYGADGKGGGTGCIIGEAAKALGASPATLQCMDDSVDFGDVLAIALDIPPFIDDTQGEHEARRWLATVQGYQDSGMDWGSAVAKADLSMDEPPFVCA